MRRTGTRRATLALVISAAIASIGGGALVLNAAPAEADQLAPAGLTAAALAADPVATPSCSLHPTRHDDGTVSFENRNGAPHFLQVFSTAGALLHNADVAPGQTVGPFADVYAVVWAGGFYPLSAYETVNWCTEVTTTTTAPPPSTTVPLVPPTTIPVTTTAPPTTTTEPGLSCLDARCTATTEPTLTVAEVAPCTTDAAGDGVCGVVVTRADLPTTGPHSGPAVRLGVGLIGFGLILVISAYRRAAAAR